MPRADSCAWSTSGRDVQCVAISPDGQTIAAGGNLGEIKLWKSETGELVKAGKLSAGLSVFSVSFSADGKTVAVTEQAKGVRLWDPARHCHLRRDPDLRGFGADFLSRRPVHGGERNGWFDAVWDLHANRKHLSVRGAAGGSALGDSRLAVIRADDGTLATIDVETGLERDARCWGQARCMRG